MQTDARPAPPAVGDAAPNVSFGAATGVPVGLAELWGATPRARALVFVRHFG